MQGFLIIFLLLYVVVLMSFHATVKRHPYIAYGTAGFIIFGLFLPDRLTGVLMLASAIWATYDAHKLEMYRYKLSGLVHAITVFLGCWLFWIIFFPWHLVNRHLVLDGIAVFKDKYKVPQATAKVSDKAVIQYIDVDVEEVEVEVEPVVERPQHQNTSAFPVPRQADIPSTTSIRELHGILSKIPIRLKNKGTTISRHKRKRSEIRTLLIVALIIAAIAGYGAWRNAEHAKYVARYHAEQEARELEYQQARQYSELTLDVHNQTNSPQPGRYNFGQRAAREARQMLANGQMLDPNSIPSTSSATMSFANNPYADKYKLVSIGDGHEKDWYKPEAGRHWAPWAVGPDAGALISDKAMQQSWTNWRPDFGEQGWGDSLDGQLQMIGLVESGFRSAREAANAYQQLDLSKPLDDRGKQAWMAQASLALGKPVHIANMVELTGMDFTPDGRAIPANQARTWWAELAAKQLGMSLSDFTLAGYRIGANGSLFDPAAFGGHDYNNKVVETLQQFIAEGGKRREVALYYTQQTLLLEGIYADVKKIPEQFDRVLGAGAWEEFSGRHLQ